MSNLTSFGTDELARMIDLVSKKRADMEYSFTLPCPVSDADKKAYTELLSMEAKLKKALAVE